MKNQKGWVALGALVMTLVGCGMAQDFTDAEIHATAVTADLKAALGVESHVGFNFANGTLTSVSVGISTLPKGVTPGAVLEKVPAIVNTEFKEKPKHIVVAFMIDQG